MKKILMYRWKAYNYRDIRKAFEACGYEVDETYQHLESYDVAPEFANKLSDMIKAGGYTFVFTVNYFAVIAEVCHDLSVPYVSWACDNPLISMYHNSVFYDTNRIFTFDYTNFKEFSDMGVENIAYLPLAVDVDRIGEIIAGADDLYVYENDISFVGSLYEKNTYDRIEDELGDYLRGYLESYMQIQSALFSESIIDVAMTPDILALIEEKFRLEKSEGSFSDLGLVFATTTLGFKTAQIARISALNALSMNHNVSIYTSSDSSPLPKVHNKGGVDYWKDMPKVFYGSRINLNFTIPNIKSGIPLRVWDVMGSGGFLLTSKSAEMDLFFKEGEDIATFKYPGELEDKAAYYMSHESERESIRSRAYEKVKAHHSYRVRMNELLSALEPTL